MPANNFIFLGSGSEWFWSMMQFLAIAVSLGFIYRQIGSQNRGNSIAALSRLEARREALWVFHTTAVSAYNRAKKARRLLKATAIDSEAGLVRPTEYRAIMTELEDIQLEFESMKRQIDLGPHLFSGPSMLRAKLHSMENFLRSHLIKN